MIRIAGFGHNRNATLASLQEVLAASGIRPDALAALAGKQHLIAELAASMALPLHIVPLEQARRQLCPTQSQASLAAYGIGSVAEATALAAAGQGARLLSGRIISSDRSATAAIAIAHEDRNP